MRAQRYFNLARTFALQVSIIKSTNTLKLNSIICLCMAHFDIHKWPHNHMATWSLTSTLLTTPDSEGVWLLPRHIPLILDDAPTRYLSMTLIHTCINLCVLQNSTILVLMLQEDAMLRRNWFVLDLYLCKRKLNSTDLVLLNSTTIPTCRRHLVYNEGHTVRSGTVCFLLTS